MIPRLPQILINSSFNWEMNQMKQKHIEDKDQEELTIIVVPALNIVRYSLQCGDYTCFQCYGSINCDCDDNN